MAHIGSEHSFTAATWTASVEYTSAEDVLRDEHGWRGALLIGQTSGGVARIGKTKAERAAWDYAKASGLELTTIHPGAMIGPALDDDASISVGMVSGLMDNSTPALPSNGFSIIDVRDVADMHVAALEHPESIGQRYLASAEYMPFPEVAKVVQELFPDRKIVQRTVPDWVIRIVAMFGGPARQIINDIGNEKIFNGSKGEKLIGHPYISARQSIKDTAESVTKFGLHLQIS